ncbi:SLATT domain-containing protein [Microbispora sp. RL4-1S]|uniref:SLATT domain-containing protein n=1 Tax=Microbispora oryzae TaxID=2806554 RepID=A0A941AKM5_9ACTN|nr:SLATT domain-containing protein [Microbispora oryzae]MBP2707351.1 SLATT domain-containing protein [Microbispora oryzae]
MTSPDDELRPYLIELERLYEDASYSAQSYFEAAKSAEFWGKAIVFIPAVVTAATSLLIALGGDKQWGAVGAVAGAVAATASFLGSGKQVSSYKDSGRRFTELRHKARMERTLAIKKPSETDLEKQLRTLRKEYGEVVSSSELIPNRLFKRVQRRIGAGVLSYEGSDEPAKGA